MELDLTEPELLQFVARTFRALWPFEVLLVLARTPRRSWGIEPLVRELRASTPVVAAGLDVLREVGLVSVDQERMYVLAPLNEELDALATALADLYDRKPRAVMRAVYSGPKGRIQDLADAFRIRKESC